MSGQKILVAAETLERQIGWKDASDDGSIDLSGNKVFSYEQLVTIAEVNAAEVLLAAVTGRKLRVVGIFMLFNGSWAVCDDIRVSDTAGSPVDILLVDQAQASNGAVHTEDVGTNTLGAFAIDLTESKGIQVRKTGTDATTGTSVLIRILYKITA